MACLLNLPTELILQIARLGHLKLDLRGDRKMACELRLTCRVLNQILHRPFCHDYLQLVVRLDPVGLRKFEERSELPAAAFIKSITIWTESMFIDAASLPDGISTLKEDVTRTLANGTWKSLAKECIPKFVQVEEINIIHPFVDSEWNAESLVLLQWQCAIVVKQLLQAIGDRGIATLKVLEVTQGAHPVPMPFWIAASVFCKTFRYIRKLSLHLRLSGDIVEYAETVAKGFNDILVLKELRLTCWPYGDAPLLRELSYAFYDVFLERLAPDQFTDLAFTGLRIRHHSLASLLRRAGNLSYLELCAITFADHDEWLNTLSALELPELQSFDLSALNVQRDNEEKGLHFDPIQIVGTSEAVSHLEEGRGGYQLWNMKQDGFSWTKKYDEDIKRCLEDLRRGVEIGSHGFGWSDVGDFSCFCGS